MNLEVRSPSFIYCSFRSVCVIHVHENMLIRSVCGSSTYKCEREGCLSPYVRGVSTLSNQPDRRTGMSCIGAKNGRVIIVTDQTDLAVVASGCQFCDSRGLSTTSAH